MEQTQRQLGARGLASLRVLSQRHELQNQKQTIRRQAKQGKVGSLAVLSTHDRA
jgi:hypothetical protein